MKNMMNRKGGLGTIVLVVLGVIVGLLLLFYFIFRGMHNGIIERDEATSSSWSQVEVVLQRRYDLIPNLVNTVKGFAEQERELLTEVTRLRSQWAQAKTVGEKVAASNEFEGVLSRLMVVSENYPNLKSNENFLALQSQLEGTENRISVERRRYNDSIRSYNTYIRSFPQSIIANMNGFETKDAYFEATKGAAEAPKVEF